MSSRSRSPSNPLDADDTESDVFIMLSTESNLSSSDRELHDQYTNRGIYSSEESSQQSGSQESKKSEAKSDARAVVDSDVEMEEPIGDAYPDELITESEEASQERAMEAERLKEETRAAKGKGKEGEEAQGGKKPESSGASAPRLSSPLHPLLPSSTTHHSRPSVLLKGTSLMHTPTKALASSPLAQEPVVADSAAVEEPPQEEERAQHAEASPSEPAHMVVDDPPASGQSSAPAAKDGEKKVEASAKLRWTVKREDELIRTGCVSSDNWTWKGVGYVSAVDLPNRRTEDIARMNEETKATGFLVREQEEKLNPETQEWEPTGKWPRTRRDAKNQPFTRILESTDLIITAYETLNSAEIIARFGRKSEGFLESAKWWGTECVERLRTDVVDGIVRADKLTDGFWSTLAGAGRTDTLESLKSVAGTAQDVVVSPEKIAEMTFGHLRGVIYDTQGTRTILEALQKQTAEWDEPSDGVCISDDLIGAATYLQQQHQGLFSLLQHFNRTPSFEGQPPPPVMLAHYKTKAAFKGIGYKTSPKAAWAVPYGALAVSHALVCLMNLYTAHLWEPTINEAVTNPLPFAKMLLYDLVQDTSAPAGRRASFLQEGAWAAKFHKTILSEMPLKNYNWKEQNDSKFGRDIALPDFNPTRIDGRLPDGSVAPGYWNETARAKGTVDPDNRLFTAAKKKANQPQEIRPPRGPRGGTRHGSVMSSRAGTPALGNIGPAAWDHQPWSGILQGQPGNVSPTHSMVSTSSYQPVSLGQHQLSRPVPPPFVPPQARNQAGPSSNQPHAGPSGTRHSDWAPGNDRRRRHADDGSSTSSKKSKQ